MGFKSEALKSIYNQRRLYRRMTVYHYQSTETLFVDDNFVCNSQNINIFQIFKPALDKESLGITRNM